MVGTERERAERSLARLLRQTLLDRMEIVCVDLAPDAVPIAGSDHPAVRYMRGDPTSLFEEAMALVVDRARAPYVAFVEDHSYAEPEWAAGIVREFERSGAALVNYAFTHVGRGTYLNRALLVAEYGRWMVPAREGEVRIPACNNVSYRVEALAPFRDRLGEWLGTAALMHREIQRRGGVAWQATDAVVGHESWGSLIKACWANGVMKRVYGGHRPLLCGWGLPRRLLYAAGMVVAPALHIARLARSFRDRPRLWGAFLEALPVCAVVYGYASWQEALGYLLGPGTSREAFTRMETAVPRER